MVALSRKAMTALSMNPSKLPRAGVNTSVRGNIMRMAIIFNDATASMMSPNFSGVSPPFVTRMRCLCFVFLFLWLVQGLCV